MSQLCVALTFMTVFYFRSKVQPRLSVKTYNDGETFQLFTVQDSKGDPNKKPCNIKVKINGR